MLVREIIRDQGPLIVCRPEDTVQTAAVILHTKYIGALPVMDAGNRLVGVFGERDIVRAFAQRLPKVEAMRVSDLMTTKVITCKPEHTVLEAMALMKRHRIRHLPVCDDTGKVLGIVSIRDTLDVLRQNAEQTAAVMRDLSIARM
ncbi:MAG: CBS domain-containing protein [Hyphomicrobiaceae bacterium]